MQTVEYLMRTLLPGGAGFPAADAPAARLLAERLHDAGVSLPEFTPPTTADAWTALVSEWEREDPKQSGLAPAVWARTRPQHIAEKSHVRSSTKAATITHGNKY